MPLPNNLQEAAETVKTAIRENPEAQAAFETILDRFKFLYAQLQEEKSSTTATLERLRGSRQAMLTEMASASAPPSADTPNAEPSAAIEAPRSPRTQTLLRLIREEKKQTSRLIDRLKASQQELLPEQDEATRHSSQTP